MKEFQGHLLFEPTVDSDRPVDHAHSAAPDGFLGQIGAELEAGSGGGFDLQGRGRTDILGQVLQKVAGVLVGRQKSDHLFLQRVVPGAGFSEEGLALSVRELQRPRENLLEAG